MIKNSIHISQGPMSYSWGNISQYNMDDTDTISYYDLSPWPTPASSAGNGLHKYMYWWHHNTCSDDITCMSTGWDIGCFLVSPRLITVKTGEESRCTDDMESDNTLPSWLTGVLSQSPTDEKQPGPTRTSFSLISTLEEPKNHKIQQDLADNLE